MNPLVSLGIPEDDIIAFDLSYSTKKPSGQEKKDYCKALIKALTSLGVTHILCNDSEYYKTLTNSKKAGHTHGVATECVFNNDINVFLGVNYSSFIYDPKQKDKLDTSIKYLVDDINGVSNVIGSNVVKYEEYIHNLSSESIWIDALNRLNQYQELTVDIETFSLNPWKAGIATIAFAWNKHEGICFALDCEPDSNGMTKRALGNFDYLLKEFFLNYKGKLIAHKATFDFTVIVARLFMKNRANIEGMFEGIDCLTKWFDDSQLCLYLATNSTSRNELSLKVAAQPYLGNYEEGSIDNLGSIKYSDLLLYNLKDVLGTWFVIDTYHPNMIEDKQHVLYEAVLKPSVAVIVQMQLVGLPLDYEACKHAQNVLQSDLDTATAVLNQSSYITTLLGVLRQKESDACHAKWKAKTAPIEHFDYVEYNPNSGLQNQILIYEVMGFTPTVFTDKKQPRI
jgi:DNA polymerase-1